MVKLQCKKEILEGLKEFRITDFVYDQYIENTRGNSLLTKEEVTKKLYRNMLLAMKSKYRKSKNDSKYMYHYGAMRLVAFGLTIVHLENMCTVPKAWYKDIKAYNELNQILDINN